jgi:hypothetical protein
VTSGGRLRGLDKAAEATRVQLEHPNATAGARRRPRANDRQAFEHKPIADRSHPLALFVGHGSEFAERSVRDAMHP